MKEKILIVEDEKALSEAYQTLLSTSDYEVEVAYDGREALEKVDAFRPSIILLDLRMPRMSGIEFLREYDPKAEQKNVKILVFSNLDAQGEIDEAYKLGADRYILKAWASPSELLKIVEEMLKDKQSHSYEK